MSVGEYQPDHCVKTIPLKLATCSYIIWLDYFYILLFASITLIIWRMPIYYFDDRLVPMSGSADANSFEGLELKLQAPLELAFPWRSEPLSSLACGMIVMLTPLLIVGMFQIKLRSLCDFHAGISGAFKAVVAT
jgi:diacylglycerol diphosphate phosphatase/phosphatidate phosphatase